MTPTKHDSKGYRLGVDVGGTFTDIILADPLGNIRVKKISSTPGQYDEGIVNGISQILEESQVSPDRIWEVCHSTTAATNAVLERKGAKVGLITTKGFRDVLELRRLRVPTLYNLFYQPPEPLVPRYLRLEVDERIDARGKILTALNSKEVSEVVGQLLDEGVESLAVCLLNSHMNTSHEEAIAKLVCDEFPRLAVSLSHQVVPAIREYERTSTTVANAYLMPVISTYLDSLRERLINMGIDAPVSVMQSNGGMMTSSMASQRPVFSLESGPVAGVSGVVHLSKNMNIPNLLTFDMGGTTTKASVIENGEPHKSIEYEIGAPISRGSRLVKGGGYLLMVRAVDVAEVGAGGGSIVSLDKAGSFQVGPLSAGAVPGPVCYDRGGDYPTTSDANLILGYLNPQYLLGGTLRVNIDKAASVFKTKVADPLGLTLLEAAYGVHIVANATMARAMRAVTTERGRDVRNFSMVAFGGSGPCHAAALAQLLGIRQVIIPALPGVFSSLGLLSATKEHEFVQSMMCRTQDTNPDSLEQAFHQLESQAGTALEHEGYPPLYLGFTRYVDLHYVGQVHELTVLMPPTGDLEDLEDAFGQEHQRTYGYLSEFEPIEITNIRVLWRQTQSQSNLLNLTSAGATLYKQRAYTSNRQAYFGPERGSLEAPLISRADLGIQPKLGPAIIEEYDTTIVVPPSCWVSRDLWWNVILQWEK